jgi:hypothetical protein
MHAISWHLGACAVSRGTCMLQVSICTHACTAACLCAACAARQIRKDAISHTLHGCKGPGRVMHGQVVIQHALADASRHARECGLSAQVLVLQVGAGQGALQIVALAVWVGGVVAFGLRRSCGPRSADDRMAVGVAWSSSAPDGQQCATGSATGSCDHRMGRG